MITPPASPITKTYTIVLASQVAASISRGKPGVMVVSGSNELANISVGSVLTGGSFSSVYGFIPSAPNLLNSCKIFSSAIRMTLIAPAANICGAVHIGRGRLGDFIDFELDGTPTLRSVSFAQLILMSNTTYSLKRGESYTMVSAIAQDIGL